MSFKKIFSCFKKKEVVNTNAPIVKDHMIPLNQYPHLKENQTLHEVVKEILSFTSEKNKRLKYSTILIINNQNKLVGKVNLKDILQGLAPHLGKACKVDKFQGKSSKFPNLAILLEDTFFKKCSKDGTKPITSFMSPIETTIKADTPSLKALAIMLDSNNFNIPVIENNQVIGVLRLEEIFQIFSTQCKLLNNC